MFLGLFFGRLRKIFQNINFYCKKTKYYNVIKYFSFLIYNMVCSIYNFFDNC